MNITAYKDVAICVEALQGHHIPPRESILVVSQSLVIRTRITDVPATGQKSLYIEHIIDGGPPEVKYQITLDKQHLSHIGSHLFVHG
jgi:hypothetical protein